VTKGSISVVAHQEIGWTVVGVVVRNRILVLIRALVIDIQTEVNVEQAIAIIVGGGRTREGPLRRIGKLKRIRLLAEFATALVQEQERAVRPYDHQVLAPVVIKVGNNRA